MSSDRWQRSVVGNRNAIVMSALCKYELQAVVVVSYGALGHMPPDFQ